MKTHVAEPQASFEFYLAPLDTHVLVERFDDAVVMRLSRDNLSEMRKLCFVRELAAEGFIPDECRWRSVPPVRWVVDPSWLKLDPEVIAQTRRFMLRSIAGAAVLWLLLMALAFYRAGAGGLPRPVTPGSLSAAHG
jgi:hypothetical protein